MLRHRVLLVRALVVGLIAMAVGLVGVVATADWGTSGDGGAGVTAGTGMADMSAREILDRATQAARHATSVHIKGEVVKGGTSARLDLHLKGVGGGFGTVTLGTREFRFTRVARDLYVTGGPGAFSELGRAGHLLEGKPVRVPASDPRFAEVAGFTDLRGIFALLLVPADGVSKGDRGDVNGRAALALLNAAGRGGTLWVATSGTPYPLRLDAPPSPGGAASGVLDFLEYGDPVTLTAPTGAVDLG